MLSPNRADQQLFETNRAARSIGLASTHGVVHDHEAAIRASGEHRKGTTSDAIASASDIEARAVQSGSAPLPVRSSGTVLVVDDEKLMRMLAREMIENSGFSVLTASGGREAIDLFREHQHEVSCVFLDLTMPDLDGAETFCELRRIRRDVRVILSSGFSEAVATERFAGQDLVGFIQKPYRLDTLIARLQAALGSADVPRS